MRTTGRAGRATVWLGGLAFAAGLMAAPSAGLAADPKTYEVLNLFGDAYDRVRRAYVDEVADDKLVESAINGLLKALDPNSTFLTIESYEALQQRGGRTYDGLGLEITMSQGVAQVIAPLDGGPAARMGLLPGDLIIEVDRTPVYGMTLTEAVDTLHGAPGSLVDLIIYREGEDPFLVTLERESVEEPGLRYLGRGGEGYVRIPIFTDDTPGEFTDAVAAMQQGLDGGLRGIVLDLRNTPGGSVEAALALVDALLTGGEVATMRGRDESISNVFSAGPGDVLDGGPVVVLVDGGTAGAAEVAAGALHDRNRAMLLGTKTFGMGSAQSLVQMGDFGYVRLTTAYYYTPSGAAIEGSGISPEVIVEPSRLVLEEERFPRRREASLRGALDNPNDAGNDEVIVAAADELDPADYQLARAFELLHALALVSEARN